MRQPIASTRVIARLLQVMTHAAENLRRIEEGGCTQEYTANTAFAVEQAIAITCLNFPEIAVEFAALEQELNNAERSRNN